MFKCLTLAFFFNGYKKTFSPESNTHFPGELRFSVTGLQSIFLSFFISCLRDAYLWYAYCLLANDLFLVLFYPILSFEMNIFPSKHI